MRSKILARMGTQIKTATMALILRTQNFQF